MYEDLSRLTVARVKQYGKTLDHIFSTNTFDIYRALGQNSKIIMMLDASVAMPLMFGLSFGSSKSRYGIAAAVLNDLCREHDIKVVVPRCYLNEMVHHGLKALDFLDVYDAFSDDIKSILKSAGNSYLSHFSRFSEKSYLTITEFLKYFGIKRNANINHISNSIESILESFGIRVIDVGRWSP